MRHRSLIKTKSNATQRRDEDLEVAYLRQSQISADRHTSGCSTSYQSRWSAFRGQENQQASPRVPLPSIK